MYSFQPIRQSFDTLVKGGQLGLWSGDLGTLHADMRVLRPTHFGSTPVFWLACLQQFNVEVRRATDAAIAAAATPPLGAVDSEGDAAAGETLTLISDAVRAQVVRKWKEKRLLGNRCTAVLVGGAPSSENLKRWIWEVFGSSVIDGYGTSETGAIATNAAVSASSSLQLVDVYVLHLPLSLSLARSLSRSLFLVCVLGNLRSNMLTWTFLTDFQGRSWAT